MDLQTSCPATSMFREGPSPPLKPPLLVGHLPPQLHLPLPRTKPTTATSAVQYASVDEPVQPAGLLWRCPDGRELVQAMSLARAAGGEHAASGNAAGTSTTRTSHAGGAAGSAGVHSLGHTGPSPHPPPVAQLVRLLWRVLPVERNHSAPALAPAVQRGASNRSSGGPLDEQQQQQQVEVDEEDDDVEEEVHLSLDTRLGSEQREGVHEPSSHAPTHPNTSSVHPPTHRHDGCASRGVVLLCVVPCAASTSTVTSITAHEHTSGEHATGEQRAETRRRQHVELKQPVALRLSVDATSGMSCVDLGEAGRTTVLAVGEPTPI